MREFDLFQDYENSRLETVDQLMKNNRESTYAVDDLGNHNVEGIPVALKRDSEGKLQATFIPDTHLLAIGATRSGKTTGFVLPTIELMLRKKNKPHLVISDPKGELYSATAKKFEKQGYRIIYLDFTDYHHSDCWNPLTKIYRRYQEFLTVEDEISVVRTIKGNRHSFRGRLYDGMAELDQEIAEAKDGIFSEVERSISTLVASLISVESKNDKYWELAARDVFAAILYGMLEDSAETVVEGRITEETFSFSTALRIYDSFGDRHAKYDGGYFSHRDSESRAFRLAANTVLLEAEKTRSGIIGVCASKLSKLRDTDIRYITCTNSFEAEEIVYDNQPTVIFLSYKDEEPLHYEIITMFLTGFYNDLVKVTRNKRKPLPRPFYFLLDEFGNLPQFNAFDKTISACGGRNIWFLLILQSYAQLYNVYGKETAEIIKDNLNSHLFFGTNNSLTKQEFSDECGKKTVLSPVSAMNGGGEYIDNFVKETIPVVPVSKLNLISPGECYLTRMRANPCLSYMERSYQCPEFSGEAADPRDRIPPIRFSDSKYKYKIPEYENKRSLHSFSPFFD